MRDFYWTMIGSVCVFEEQMTCFWLRFFFLRILRVRQCVNWYVPFDMITPLGISFVFFTMLSIVRVISRSIFEGGRGMRNLCIFLFYRDSVYFCVDKYLFLFLLIFTNKRLLTVKKKVAISLHVNVTLHSNRISC